MPVTSRLSPWVCAASLSSPPAVSFAGNHRRCRTIGITRPETPDLSRPAKESEQLMTYIADPRVDAYIDALPAWQQPICREVRDLVHAADPAVTETIKRTV